MLLTRRQPKSANLARIRDNQRRSRARRKEYVQELEAKYRETEAKGVQASAEMQQAARKVVDENKQLREENLKLRSLLHQIGMPDPDIQRHLATGPAVEPPMSPTFEKNMFTATQDLENLLRTRIDVKT